MEPRTNLASHYLPSQSTCAPLLHPPTSRPRSHFSPSIPLLHPPTSHPPNTHPPTSRPRSLFFTLPLLTLPLLTPTPPPHPCCVRSNFVGTSFTVYDNGVNPGKGVTMVEGSSFRQELAAVVYVSHLHVTNLGVSSTYLCTLGC